MSKKLVSFVKYNKTLLFVYRKTIGLLIFFLKFFVAVNDNKILFMSFGGQKYDDSPKVLYEHIAADPFFDNYELIWGFKNPDLFDINCKKVKVDTIKFYVTALSSKIWIDNSSVERGLNLKRNSTIEINTWHGTPLKKMGEDIVNNSSYFAKQKKVGKYLYCAQSEYDRDIFTRFFAVSKCNILISDLPRNDDLILYSRERIEQIKKELNIPQKKKVILYAPTFREYSRDKFNLCYIKPPIDLDKWKKKLGEDYVVLFRAHYEVVNILGITENDFIRNVSCYGCLNDLMAVSDILISDYSSIYFDYSILEKPMLNYSYDLKEYSAKRGLYLDLYKTLPCQININEDSLLEEILTLDYDKYCSQAKVFKERFAPVAGNASKLIISELKKMIM